MIDKLDWPQSVGKSPTIIRIYSMSPVHVLDRYYLAITALITLAWQLAGFFIAWTLQVRPFSHAFLQTK
jgi:hypothetical protein